MCDTLVAVRPGRVLFAKNSDRDPNEAQVLDWQPRRDHAPGEVLRCTWIAVDQVPTTHAVLLSRPFWTWGAEMGANEHGVVIGNEAVFTDQPYAPTGLLGMDLVRLGLERAATAEAAVDAIVGLLERHGQGGGCSRVDPGFTYHNSYLMADPTGAFVLETAGALWAVERVTSGVRSISNGLTIPGFADHGDRLRTWYAQARTRRALTAACPAESVGDLMSTLRTHGSRGPNPRFAPFMGAKGAPCMHAGGGIRATSQTTGSWVAELGADGDQRHWATGTAAPCTGVFLPVAVDDPLDLGPEPTDRFDAATWWWRHELLHRAVLADPDRLLATYARDRDALEARWIADRPDPATAVADADARTGRWLDAVRSADGPDRRPGRARRFWAALDERAGMPAVDAGVGA
jgi:secernin